MAEISTLGYSKRPNNPFHASLGDSITANGIAGSSASSVTASSRNWGQWAASMSGRRFAHVATIGTGGYRTDQIITDLLPLMLSKTAQNGNAFPTPGRVSVLAGTNNMGQIGGTDSYGRTITIATTLTDLQTIYNQLLAAGMTPIACALTPRNDIVDNIMKLNAGIAQLAAQMGLLFVDFYNGCVDPTTGGLASGYNISGDSVHPNATGAKAMGQILANALNFLPVSLPDLRYQNNNIMWANSLFLTDVGGDGIPDGWSGNINGHATPSILSGESGIIGNAFAITMTDNVAGATFPRSPTLAAVPGDWVAFTVKLSYAPAGTTPSGAVYLKQLSPSPGNTFAGFDLSNVASPAVPPVSTGGYIDLYKVIRVPAGATTGVGVEMAASGTGSVLKIAQCGAYNLTAMGLAVL